MPANRAPCKYLSRPNQTKEFNSLVAVWKMGSVVWLGHKCMGMAISKDRPMQTLSKLAQLLVRGLVPFDRVPNGPSPTLEISQQALGGEI